MTNHHDTNLEAVLESIEAKLKKLEDERSDLHDQIVIKRGQVQDLTQTIQLLREMDGD